MESDVLSKLPEISSYQSCIKSYGRSILPPLVLLSDKERLESYRNSATIVEARIIARKKMDSTFTMLIQKIANCVSAEQETPEIVIGDCLQESGEQSTSTAVTPSSLSQNANSDAVSCNAKTFRTGIHYEEIVDDDTSLSSINFDPEKQTSDNFSMECDLNGINEHFSEKDCSSDASLVVNYSGMSSEERILSEVEDTECSASLLTVIMKNESRSDDENDSTATSFNQSTDLDKYLDSSFDIERFSEGSVMTDERKENFHNPEGSTSESVATLVNSSPNSTPVMLVNSENDFTNTNVLQHELGIFLQANFSNHYGLKQNLPVPEIDSTNGNALEHASDIFSQANSSIPNEMKQDLLAAETAALVMNSDNIVVSNKLQDGIGEIKSQKSWLKKVLDKAQALPKVEVKGNSQSSENNDVNTVAVSRPGHVRSNSYTLDSPSPCLALCHNGCRCEKSPETVTSPHCRSVPSESDSIENTMPEDNQPSPPDNPKTALIDEDNAKNEISLSCIIFDEVPKVKSECNDPANIDTTNRTPNEMLSPVNRTKVGIGSKSEHRSMSIRELYKKFVTMRERTFDDLHKEHVKQWKELSIDFEKQEQRFLERLSFLELNQSRNSNSPPETSKDTSFISSNSQCPVKISQPAILMPISSVRSYIANNNFSEIEYQKRSIESRLNDPTMQKNFEKVSAAVKGYLTRRLWKSDAVQANISSIKDCARQVAEINNEVERKGGIPTIEDRQKHRQIFNKMFQVDAELHNIFFGMGIKEKMKIISDFREAKKQPESNYVLLPLGKTRILKDLPSVPPQKRKLSSATLKALERKQLSVSMASRSQSIPDLQVSKKSLNVRTRARKRILSPRSCTVSPPPSRISCKSNSPGKRNLGVNKTNKARRSLY